MPRLRLQAYLDGHVIGADLIEQIVEFIKRADRVGAGGLKEHLKRPRAVSPDQRLGIQMRGVLIVDS